MVKRIENKSLRIHLKRLFGELLNHPNINEIAINRFGEIWTEGAEGWQLCSKEACSRVTPEHVRAFSNAMAVEANQKFDQSSPILGCTLPNDERLQIIHPPACDPGQFSITIRKPSAFKLSLDKFQKDGFFERVVLDNRVKPMDQELWALLNKKMFKEFFSLAVASGEKNIVIAGATGSGKTTFMKSLIEEIPSQERLITIEDVRELFLTRHPNHVNLLYPSEQKSQTNVSPSSLLKSCLRMKPDRILLAELRGAEAFDYINVINSGHGGSLTSLHAGSKEEVLRRLTLMTLQHPSASQLPYETARSIIQDTIDIIVVIEKIGQKRCITSLHWKDYAQLCGRLPEAVNGALMTEPLNYSESSS